MAKQKIYKIAFWSFAALVLFATLTPLDGIKIDIPFTLIDVDKLVHLSIFLLLTILLYLAYPVRQHALRMFIYLSAYGIIIEILQQVLPLGRSFDWMDWMYDMVGIGIGVLILRLLKSQIHRYLLSDSGTEL